MTRRLSEILPNRDIVLVFKNLKPQSDLGIGDIYKATKNDLGQLVIKDKTYTNEDLGIMGKGIDTGIIDNSIITIKNLYGRYNLSQLLISNEFVKIDDESIIVIACDAETILAVILDDISNARLELQLFKIANTNSITCDDEDYDEDDCEEIAETEEEEKEETNMFSKDELNFGGKITDGRFKLTINGLAVLSKKNKYVTYNPKDNELVEATNGFFDKMNDLLFYMPTVELEVGDVILHQNTPYYITKADGETIEGVNYENATRETLIPKKNVFGQAFYIKVFNALGTNNILNTGLAANPMMAYMLMGSDGEKDMDMSKLMMLQAMNGGEGIADFSSNPIMAMALMGKDGGDMSDFVKMTMLSQMSKKAPKKAEVTDKVTSDKKENAK